MILVLLLIILTYYLVKPIVIHGGFLLYWQVTFIVIASRYKPKQQRLFINQQGDVIYKQVWCRAHLLWLSSDVTVVMVRQGWQYDFIWLWRDSVTTGQYRLICRVLHNANRAQHSRDNKPPI